MNTFLLQNTAVCAKPEPVIDLLHGTPRLITLSHSGLHAVGFWFFQSSTKQCPDTTGGTAIGLPISWGGGLVVWDCQSYIPRMECLDTFFIRRYNQGWCPHHKSAARGVEPKRARKGFLVLIAGRQ